MLDATIALGNTFVTFAHVGKRVSDVACLACIATLGRGWRCDLFTDIGPATLIIAI